MIVYKDIQNHVDKIDKAIRDVIGLPVYFRAIKKWWKPIQTNGNFARVTIPIMSHMENELLWWTK